MPFHGEYRMLKMHANIGIDCGIPKENTFILKNGEMLSLINHQIKKSSESLEDNDIYIDGSRIGEVSTQVIRDRRIMSNDGILVVIANIDMKNRKIYIFSNGENYNKITDAKAETITDNIYELATDKKYYECAKEAYKQILTVLEGGKIAEPMKYISNAVLAVMVALFINFAIFKIATNNKKASGNEQIKECERFFEHTTPVVTRTGSHSVYSPQRDSSAGGGSSGGGGGRRRRWRWPQLLK